MSNPLVADAPARMRSHPERWFSWSFPARLKPRFSRSVKRRIPAKMKMKNIASIFTLLKNNAAKCVRSRQ
jgi:hypothetical protein